MHINFKKSHYLDIKTKSSLTVSPLTELTAVTETRILGIIFNENMKWNAHIEAVVKRASKLLFAVYRLKQMSLPARVLWNVYYSLVRSVITFAFPAFCNLSQYLFNRLLRLEGRVARIIGSKPPTSIETFCNSLCSKLACKIQREPQHPLCKLTVPRKDSGYALRKSRSHLCRPRAMTARYQNSFIRYI